MKRKEWLESLTPGDKVAVESGFIGLYEGIYEVSRITKTSIFVKFKHGELRLKRSSGFEHGGARDYNKWSIDPVTPEIEDKINRTKYIAHIQTLKNLCSLKTPILKQIYGIIKNENTNQKNT